MTSGFGESPHIYEFGNMPKGEQKFFKDGNSEGTMFRCVGLEYDLLGGKNEIKNKMLSCAHPFRSYLFLMSLLMKLKHE